MIAYPRGERLAPDNDQIVSDSTLADEIVRAAVGENRRANAIIAISRGAAEILTAGSDRCAVRTALGPVAAHAGGAALNRAPHSPRNFRLAAFPCSQREHLMAHQQVTRRRWQEILHASDSDETPVGTA